MNMNEIRRVLVDAEVVTYDSSDLLVRVAFADSAPSTM